MSASVQVRVCKDCGQTLDIGMFSTKSAACKPCMVLRAKAWKATNPDRHRVNQARSRDNTREKRRADGRARYYRLMAEDPEGVRERRLAYAKTEKGAIYNRLAAHKRRGVRYDAEGREYVALILKDPCVYCGGDASEVDHITPITKGGSGQAMNLAPACRTCNARKNDDSLLVFMLRLKQAA